MKKQFFYLMAAAATLAACSTNEDLGANPGTENAVDANQLTAINLNAALNAQATMTTRATVGGIVNEKGDAIEGVNTWNGEDLYVYMMWKKTLNPTKETTGTENIYWDQHMTAPTYDGQNAVTDEILSREDQAVKYYPLADYNEKTGAYGFDFYGYHDGGAVTNHNAAYYTAKGETADATNGKYIGVDFKITGKEDLMQGKATLPTAATDYDKDWETNHKDDKWENVTSRAYSAYAARRDVQPHINFNHLLTRLAFTVEAGNEITAGYAKGQATTADAAANFQPTKDGYHEAMKVTGIKITKTNTSGRIVIAQLDGETIEGMKNNIVWSGEAKDEVALYSTKTEKDGETTTTTEEPISETNAVTLTGNYKDAKSEYKFSGDKVKVGDAIMVKSGDESYNIEISLEQRVRVHEKTDENDDANWEVKKQTITGTIKRSDISTAEGADNTFQPGTSYAVNIKVYGFEKIEIYGNLIAWQQGKDINSDVDNADDKWTVKENTTEKNNEGE